ncbi:MAG: hypothetical protein HYT93_03875 [Parcubacteria group bacterium]|nr:hypothetical protein [Parcubacteria group bacterium]
MDPEEQKILERILKLSEENNKLLKKINRSIQWGRFIHALYWVIIIGSAVGAYYFLQPFFDAFTGALGTVGAGVENLQKVGGSLPDIGGLLQQFNIQR